MISGKARRALGIGMAAFGLMGALVALVGIYALYATVTSFTFLEPNYRSLAAFIAYLTVSVACLLFGLAVRRSG